MAPEQLIWTLIGRMIAMAGLDGSFKDSSFFLERERVQWPNMGFNWPIMRHGAHLMPSLGREIGIVPLRWHERFRVNTVWLLPCYEN